MRNLFVWKHCPDNLHRNVLCAQLLQTPYYMVAVSMEASLSGQVGFGISNTVCSFWRKWPWPARSPDQEALHYLATSEARYTKHVLPTSKTYTNSD